MLVDGILQMDTAADDERNGEAVNDADSRRRSLLSLEEAQTLVLESKFRAIIPFLALLLIRCIFTYASRVGLIVGILAGVQFLSSKLEEQTNLYARQHSKVLWMIALTSLGVFLGLLIIVPVIFKFDLGCRLAILPLQNDDLNFLDTLWICVVSDASIVYLVLLVKTLVCLALPLFFSQCKTSIEARIPRYDVERGEFVTSDSSPLLSSRRRESNPSQHNIPLLNDDSKRIDDSLHYLKHKKVTLWVNMVTNAYRMLISLPVWLCYFSHGAGSDILPLAYVCFKIVAITPLFNKIVECLKRQREGHLKYGHYSSSEEMQQCQSKECAICYESYYNPVTLGCSHVFCEHCICQWLDKESTCPVCRSVVRNDEPGDWVYDTVMTPAMPLVIF